LKVELLSITPKPEKLIEIAGRTSFRSYQKMKKDSEIKFIKSLLKNNELSVLEHACASFKISGVSRSFTHQLVRHRLCSYTQQSQRHINESNFNYIEPKLIKENHIAHDIFMNIINKSKEAYLELQKLGINNEDARFVLPNAVESQIVITANFREWRHIIELRGDKKAQWEIRIVIIEILKILKKYAPTVFSDFDINDSDNLIIKI